MATNPGWHGESARHAMAARGIPSAIAHVKKAREYVHGITYQHLSYSMRRKYTLQELDKALEALARELDKQESKPRREVKITDIGSQ